MGERIFETSVRVRYKETDQMGVVHHTNYIVWFEVGRTDLLRQLGLSYRDLEGRGILLPVVDLSCRYMEAARYDDEIRILTRIADLTPGKIIFSYEIRRKPDDAKLARGIHHPPLGQPRDETDEYPEVLIRSCTRCWRRSGKGRRWGHVPGLHHPPDPRSPS